jgi:tetratricopeptide (TPR) repeat protein
MNHTSKLRAEAKHDAGHRQLRAMALALLLAGLPARGGVPVPPPPSAREELHAAKLLEAALYARQAGPDDWQKMERIYTDLEAKYPRNANIMNGHAEFLWSIDERQRAVEAWLAAEKVDPANAAVLDHLGGSFLAAGEVKKSAGYYARATASAPDNAAYHFAYANVAFLFRHDLHDATHPDSESVLAEALKQFSEAVRLQPLNADYARAFAEAFYTVAKPDWHAALQAWQHFHDISPQKDFALLNLARVQMKLGEKAEARASLEKVQGSEFARAKARLSERIDAE